MLGFEHKTLTSTRPPGRVPLSEPGAEQEVSPHLPVVLGSSSPGKQEQPLRMEMTEHNPPK